MIQNNPQDVSTAFEALLEEVEAEVDFVNTVGSRSFEGRDYDRAKEALARAGVLIAFRDKVSALRAEWQTIAAVAEQEEDEETKAERRNLGRLRNGLRTPEAAYREPILRVLQSMGGSGKAADVLEKRRRQDKRKGTIPVQQCARCQYESSPRVCATTHRDAVRSYH